MGKLEDGEFDFNETPGLGDGDAGGPTSDIPVKDVNADLQVLEQRFAASGRQLSVMESLMFDHQLQQNAVPSRMPIRNSYVTSGFGTRAAPFGRGAAPHKGMDFPARLCRREGRLRQRGRRRSRQWLCHPLRAQFAPGGEGR
ncbi:hypothetical protein G6F52_013676 [Rhizopus delemar]|nr:hypothetical protein G6F52_013676 [Rhizopus delemar]